MFNTILKQLVALIVVALLAVLFIGGVGLQAQGQLVTELSAARLGEQAVRNHLETDIVHENLRGLVEQFVGAVRDKDAARQQAAAEELKENAQAFIQGFSKNLQLESLPEEIRADLARLQPGVNAYANAALVIAGQSADTDAAVLEKLRADYSKNFNELEKPLEAVSEKIDAFIAGIEEEGISVASRARVLVVGGAMLAILIATGLGLSLYRNVADKTLVIGNTIDQINTGDLQARTKMEGQDELDQLGNAFDKRPQRTRH
jgi:methyl-accepting chemotaxis protein